VCGKLFSSDIRRRVFWYKCTDISKGCATSILRFAVSYRLVTFPSLCVWGQKCYFDHIKLVLFFWLSRYFIPETLRADPIWKQQFVLKRQYIIS